MLLQLSPNPFNKACTCSLKKSKLLFFLLLLHHKVVNIDAIRLWVKLLSFLFYLILWRGRCGGKVFPTLDDWVWMLCSFVVLTSHISCWLTMLYRITELFSSSPSMEAFIVVRYKGEWCDVVYSVEFLGDDTKWDMWALVLWCLCNKSKVCDAISIQNDLSY